MLNRAIICGSKPYNNLDLDPLVDSFKLIVRNNMLLPGNGYGAKEANFQVLNSHVYEHHIKNKPIEAWIAFYHKKYKMPISHLEEFRRYTQTSKHTQFVNFRLNNIHAFRDHFKSNNIDFKLIKELRCGFSFIGQCLKSNKVPFLIGFSLVEQDFDLHAYNGRSSGVCHDKNQEISMLKLLHKRGEIDASFCALLDQNTFQFDETLLVPTEEARQIIESVYG